MHFVLFQQVMSTIFRRLVRLCGRLADLSWRNLCSSISWYSLRFFQVLLMPMKCELKHPLKSEVATTGTVLKLHFFWSGFNVVHFPQGKGMPQMYGPALTSACVSLQHVAPWSGWLRGREPRVCQQFVGRPNLWNGTHHIGHRTG